MLVLDAAAYPESGNMWVEFYTIAVPHRKLFLGIAPIRFARERIPRPDLERIEQVQLLRQSSRCQVSQTANKISVDIVGMIFIFHKRSICIDIANANGPKLPHEYFEVVDESLSPVNIP